MAGYGMIRVMIVDESRGVAVAVAHVLGADVDLPGWAFPTRVLRRSGRAVGARLTGLGTDGADGLKLMRHCGAVTQPQAAASSTVPSYLHAVARGYCRDTGAPNRQDERGPLMPAPVMTMSDQLKLWVVEDSPIQAGAPRYILEQIAAREMNGQQRARQKGLVQ